MFGTVHTEGKLNYFCAFCSRAVVYYISVSVQVGWVLKTSSEPVVAYSSARSKILHLSPSFQGLHSNFPVTYARELPQSYFRKLARSVRCLQIRRGILAPKK